MFRSTRTLLLAGALAAGGVTAAVTGVLADAPGAGQTQGDKPWGKHGRGMGLRMGDKLAAHAQELGLNAQQLQAIKNAEEAARPELERLHQQLQARHQALRTQIEGILTAEQKTKLQALRAERRHHGFRGPRGAEGQQPGVAPQK